MQKELPLTSDYFYKSNKLKSGYRSSCKKCTNMVQSKYQRDHKEAVNAYHRQYYSNCKEEIAILKKNWKLNNIGKINSYTAKRRAIKLSQTPTDADFEKISEFYVESQRLTLETGIIHHVDHIIPLSKGGLHHQDNLQVLTAEENLKKGSKLI